MTAQFTEKQLDNFRRYVRIWKSHTFNMFDPRARSLDDQHGPRRVGVLHG